LGALAREYGPQIAEFGQTVGAWLGENLPGAIATLQEIFNRVFVNEGPAALATLRGVFEEVWPWIQSLVGTVVTWFQENLPLIQQTGQTLADFFSNHVAPTLDNAWTIIKTVVEIAINAVLGIIKLGMELINGDWDAAWTTFKDSVGGIWEGIKTVLSEFLEGILNAIGTNTDEFVATWRGNWEKLKEIVSGVLDGVKNFVQNFSLVEVGSNLIAGFIDGIKSAASAVTDAVGNVIQGGIDAAKNLLLMDSPSKVFEEMGQFSGEGYEIGLRESSAGVAVAGTSMATQALQGASAAGSGFTMGGFSVQIGEVHIHDDRDVDDLVEQISARLGAALEGRLRPLRGAV
jgi:phage-related protein